MYEWNETVQKMLDWVENNIGENPTLLRMSEQVGYSPYYCSVQFHKICGMTIKRYIAGRRMALTALALRNTNERIIDIAFKYGFSSQEALTRAFAAAFGCSPAAYRKNPIPIPYPIRKVVFFPEHYSELYKGGSKMNEITEARVRVEFIPAHRYIGIWDDMAESYGSFWERHNCDEVCGIIDSMSNVSDLIITAHTAGWTLNKGKHRYFYGLGVPENYCGTVPEGFEIRDIFAGYYLVFYHPPFDFLKHNGEVMSRVEQMAWNYDIRDFGGRYIWNESAPCYQRHYPEGIGYEILRPIILNTNS